MIAAISPIAAQPTAAAIGFFAPMEKKEPPMLTVAHIVKNRLFILPFLNFKRKGACAPFPT